MWVVWACELMGCVSAHSVVFFKDDANHFGEIGIDVPSVYPFSGASQVVHLGVGTYFSHRVNPRDPARYRGV